MADVNNENNLEINPKSAFFQGGRDSFKHENDSAKMKQCFELFDDDCDGFLDEVEFNSLLKSLFRRNGEFYVMEEDLPHKIFKLLDEKQEGHINEEMFRICWHHWIKQIIDPVSALLVIDVQNDFIDGTLAIKHCPAKEDGEAVVPVINHMLGTSNFHLVVYSFDWHPKNHISFIECVNERCFHHTSKVSADDAQKYDTVVFSSPRVMEQQLWPSHCVQDSWGAQLHPRLKVVDNSVNLYKGTNPDIDSYSAFWDNKQLAQTDLIHELTQRGITDVFICGLAYDVCVGATASHALDHGFRTVVIDDACRGVNEPDIENTKKKLQARGAVIVNSEQVHDMVHGLDRRPELGYAAALNVANARKLINEEADTHL